MTSAGIALTFDDGPHPDVTPRVLDILRDAGARATFFVLGEQVRAHPDLARRIVHEGHGIGNHTDTHPNLQLTLSASRVRAEIVGCQDTVMGVTGVTPAVFRAPHGRMTRAAWRACRELGLASYDWSVAPEGWPKPKGVDELVASALGAARPGAIIDLHDVPWHDDAGPRTIEALPAILEGLAARGLVVELLPECRS
jgi:peptidoglycan/xylan/chitin deacetylase (PgdA/CDA1 family)